MKRWIIGVVALFVAGTATAHEPDECDDLAPRPYKLSLKIAELKLCAAGVPALGEDEAWAKKHFKELTACQIEANEKEKTK